MLDDKLMTQLNDFLQAKDFNSVRNMIDGMDVEDKIELTDYIEFSPFLIGDKAVVVRRELAKKGIGLDKLANDEDWLVRCIADNYSHNYPYKY